MFLGFGAANGPARGTPRAAPPSEAPASAFARSAVPRSSESCPTCCSTVIAFPPPARSTRRVGTAFRRPSGTTRSSDFCRAIVLCSCVLGATACAEPGRSPWVRPMIFVTTSSPVQPRRVRISGFAAGCRLTRRGCLTALRLRSIQPRTYDFHQTSPRGLLGVMSPPKDLVLQANALVSSVSGSLRRAPGLDFHLLIVGHARRTPLGRSRDTADDGCGGDVEALCSSYAPCADRSTRG